MSALFLTKEELQELTGYRLHAWQRRWLDQHNWKYEVAINGRPVVLRGFAEAKMGGQSGMAPAEEPEPHLYFDCLRKPKR